jgi:hypothetical protein
VTPPIPKLERIVAALVLQSPKRELRLKLSHIRKLSEESFRLSVDIDDRADEVVVRFDPKHDLIYAVEADPSPASANAQQVQPQRQTVTASGTVLASAKPSTTPAMVRAPLTDQQLSQLEHRLRQKGIIASLKREAKPQTTIPAPEL